MGKTWRKSKLGKRYQDKDKFKWELHRKDRSCLRHNGGCPYCEGNRTYKYKKSDKMSKLEIVEFHG